MGLHEGLSDLGSDGEAAVLVTILVDDAANDVVGGLLPRDRTNAPDTSVDYRILQLIPHAIRLRLLRQDTLSRRELDDYTAGAELAVEIVRQLAITELQTQAATEALHQSPAELAALVGLSPPVGVTAVEGQ